jgi:hypothetical protein
VNNSAKDPLATTQPEMNNNFRTCKYKNKNKIRDPKTNSDVFVSSTSKETEAAGGSHLLTKQIKNRTTI